MQLLLPDEKIRNNSYNTPFEPDLSLEVIEVVEKTVSRKNEKEVVKIKTLRGIVNRRKTAQRRSRFAEE